MNECTYCQICYHSRSAFIVYEDTSVVAVMAPRPITPGHVVVIPRNHSRDCSEISDSDLAHLTRVARYIGILQKKRLEARGFTLLSVDRDPGEAEGHCHFHVIPRFEDDGLDWPLPGRERSVSPDHRAYELLQEPAGQKSLDTQ